MICLFMNRYTFLPWNIMVMAVLTGITGGISLLTGIIGIIGGVIRKKSIILITMVAVIFSCSVVTFIGLYSFSGILNTTDTLEMGWNHMNEKEIPHFEEIWECHGFNAEQLNQTNTTTTESQDGLPYCSDVLNKPFKKYSGVMLSFSIIIYILLLGIICVVSIFLVKGDVIKKGFESFGDETEKS